MGSGTCRGNRSVPRPRHPSRLASLGVVQESVQQRPRQKESRHPSAHYRLSAPRRHRRHTHRRHRRSQFHDRSPTLSLWSVADHLFPLARCQEVESVSQMKRAKAVNTTPSDTTAFASYQDLISLSEPWMDVGCLQAKKQEDSLLLAQHL